MLPMGPVTESPNSLRCRLCFLQLRSGSDALWAFFSLYLPEAARAAQVAEVSVGGHPAVGLAAQNDGGCRRDCEDEQRRGGKMLKTTTTISEWVL